MPCLSCNDPNKRYFGQGINVSICDLVRGILSLSPSRYAKKSSKETQGSTPWPRASPYGEEPSGKDGRNGEAGWDCLLKKGGKVKTCEEAYQRLQEQIANQISDLQNVLATQDKDNKDWGYVADLAMISKRLRKIIDFIGRNT